MESDQRRVISLLVDNQSGVLARVSSLFCRRGFNIDSLTVSATNDPAVSRITVTITSDEKALQQKGPTWIECIIDKDEKVLPMIPGGGDINDIIME